MFNSRRKPPRQRDKRLQTEVSKSNIPSLRQVIKMKGAVKCKVVGKGGGYGKLEMIDLNEDLCEKRSSQKWRERIREISELLYIWVLGLKTTIPSMAPSTAISLHRGAGRSEERNSKMNFLAVRNIEPAGRSGSCL